ncbi:RTE1-like protein [Drosera capensis]
MARDGDPELQPIFKENPHRVMQIDSGRARFPCCIVWAPLPGLSWLLPFIGHVGICREDGVILDFAGPNFVCVDNFAFGSATRYIQIDKEKSCCLVTSPAASRMVDGNGSERQIMTWDDALRNSTQEFQHRSYNLLTCNCHSFVANNLNRLSFNGGGWNVINLAALMFIKGRWVSRGAMIKSFLPFAIIVPIGLAIGGLSFLKFLAFFCFVLVGWFVLGSYCFKSLIQL